MRELLVRTISGLIYMTLILFAMYADAQYYLLLTACFGLLTLFEFQRLVQIKSLLPYAIFVLLFVGIHQDIFPEWMDLVIGVLGVLMNTYLILNLLEFMSHQRLERKYILMVFYIMIGVITMGLIPQISGDYDMNLIAGVFILIWVNDSMAYLVGVNFGRHKLLEHMRLCFALFLTISKISFVQSQGYNKALRRSGGHYCTQIFGSLRTTILLQTRPCHTQPSRAKRRAAKI